ncbi:peptidylprolyl isomerase [Bacillus subtilis]
MSNLNFNQFKKEADNFKHKHIDEKQEKINRIEKEIDKKQIQLDKLNDEVAKSLMGESKFTPEQLSGAISKTENDIEELKGSIKLIKKDMSGSLAKMSDIEEFKKDNENWIDRYKQADIDAKKMMISKLVKNVIFKDGELQIDFHYTVEKSMIISRWLNTPFPTATGGPGYTIKCETEGNPHTHEAGALSMAHAGKDTGGSQFFIVHEPQPHLNGVHTVFGKVTSGLEFAKNMSNGDVMKEVRVEG